MIERSNTHLDPETIAALVDGTLAPAARAEAEAHIARCADCREVWVETIEIESETRTTATTTSETSREVVVSPRPASRRSWIYAAAGLAAAAVVAIAVVPGILNRGELDPSVAGLLPEAAKTRFASARLSVALPYRPAPSAQRGASEDIPPSVLRAELDLRERATKDATVETLHAAGLGALAIREPGRAIELLDSAARIAPENGSILTDLAAALLARWEVSGEPSDAVRALDAAKRAALSDQAGPAAQFNLALAFEAVGLTHQAKSTFEQYLRQDATSEWAAEARARLAALDARQSSSANSLSPIYQRLEGGLWNSWSQAIKSGANLDFSSLDRAHAELVQGGGDAAMIALLEAAAASDALQPRVRSCLADAVAALSSWGEAFEAGRSEVALASAEAARANLSCAGQSTVDAESRRAISLIELLRGPEADAVSSRVLAVAERDGLFRSAARAYQARGLFALQEGRFSDAVDHSLRAVEAARKSRDLEFTSALETHLASLYSKQGDLREGWRHLFAALQGEPTTSSARRRYSILARAALSALEMRLAGAALAFSDAVIARTSDWSNPVGQAFAHLKRAEALALLGRATEATQAVGAGRRLISDVASAAVRQNLEAQADYTEGLVETAGTVALNRLDGAIGYFTRTNNRIMLAPALLARGRTRTRLNDTQAAEQDWRAGVGIIDDQRKEIRDAQLQVSRIDRVWELFDELIRAVARDRPLEALDIVERHRGRQLLDSLSRDQIVESLRGERLHQWLPPDTSALVYSALPDRLLVWHLTTGGVTLTAVDITREALARHVEALRAGMATGSRSEALSRLLLPKGFQPLQHLVLVADGPLHLVPFGSLRLADGPRLLERTVLVTAPSLSVAATASSRPTSTTAPLLVAVAEAVPAAQLPWLPGALQEVEGLRSLYPGATTLMGSGASVSEVLASLGKHDVVHFAGHAVVDAVYPSRSHLVLARGELMTAARISSARLRPGATVFLGACDTANGEIYQGEGVMALSRAFLAAGAGSVVGSLWKLDDKDSRPFAIEFHRRLKTAGSASEALRATQQQWIQDGRPPSVWAAFQVTGGLPPSRSKG